MFSPICSCVWLLSAATVVALDTRALIEQALDEPTQITLENIKLSDAIGRLSEQTGVRITMTPETMALVPYGASTTIQKVEIANIPLRQGLTQLFDPLGMTFEVRDDSLTVVPKEGILCLGRAPTWAELDLLNRLGTIQPGVDAPSLDQLRLLIQFQINVPEPWAVLAEAIRSVGAGPADEVLSVACHNLGWSWCLSDNRVVVSSMEQQIRRQLQQSITMGINNRPLFDVLERVSNVVHVPIRLDAGITLPKNYSFNICNVPAERVLDRIAAETGLGYLVESEGVVFYSVGGGLRPTVPSSLQATPVSAPSNDQPDPWWGKIVLPLDDGTSIEFPIRESEVPADIREFRERSKSRVFEVLRSELRGDQP